MINRTFHNYKLALISLGHLFVPLIIFYKLLYIIKLKDILGLLIANNHTTDAASDWPRTILFLQQGCFLLKIYS